MLYEILKTSKLGASFAPDMYTALWAQKLARDGEVKTLSGAPPLSFKANGQPLLDYLISGNTVQSGTPTPDNPVMPQGTGERTGNLLDYTTVESTTNATATQISGGISVSGRYYVRFRTVEFTVGSTYTMSWKANTTSGTSAPSWRFHYSDNTYSSMPSSGGALIAEKEVSELLLYVSTSESCIVEFTEIMLNTGSTAFPYKPFGYEIPISSAGQTTPIYLGEVETTRKIRKYEFTGNETYWVYDSTHERFVFTLTGSLIIAVRRSPVLSSHFQGIDDGRPIGEVPNNSIYSGSGYSQWYIKTTDYTDVTTFKAYLQQQYANGTPVTVWYVLANEETGIVNEPLMKIGEYADTVSKAQAGVEIPTARGANMLDVLADVKPSNVYLKYKEV